jgi:hypothetical protein
LCKVEAFGSVVELGSVAMGDYKDVILGDNWEQDLGVLEL